MSNNLLSSLSPHDLTCEHFANPVGIDVASPRLSWKSRSDLRGARQTAYQIVVAASDAALDGDLLWDSGKVASDQSLHVAYGGPALQPHQRCWWRVRVWDEHDAPSVWSAPAFWEMGLLGSAWQAEWITPAWDDDASGPRPSPILRCAFTTGDIASARIYATSLGLYELHVNGQRVGDAVLTPGWTSYHERIQYQAYDVTDLLRDGDNAIGATLGDGWWRGHMGFEGQRNNYGDQVALLLQLRIVHGDGRVEIIGSDDRWRASTGAIRTSDIYMGETVDARCEPAGWTSAGFDASAWQAVKELDHSKEIVVAQIGPFVTRHERITPTRVFTSPKGETILDFGQNMVGWVQVRASGPAGTTITLRHAEVLDQQGNLYTENLRRATQATQFILKGEGEEIFEPHFTFQGFQFVAVDGYPGEVKPDHFTGVVLHSAMPAIGAWECNNPLLNQLQHNIVWGQKGNFVDVPTDCPQRDERLGWTGDAQAFVGTACYNMNVGAFFAKWLRDVAADQHDDGAISFVVPELPRKPGSVSLMSNAGAAAWSDAGVICPWVVYQHYGDVQLLEAQFDSMVGWVNYIRDHADEDLIWRKGFQFGDWLDYRGSFALKPSPVTNDELIGTAYFAYSAGLLAKMANVLGRSADTALYADLSDRVKAAFNKEFVTESGRVGPNSQTAYTVALHFDLLPEAMRPLAAQRLAEEIIKASYHITTGFVGTPYICHALSRHGQTDVAYELLNQESFPSWLYPVKRGATTIWERWDGIKPDGSFQDAGMNSFNHYAYGSIGEWMFAVVAGIAPDPDAPGYKHVLIAPQPGGGLTHVKASLDTPYGLVESEWHLTERDMQLRVVVPANAKATVKLPASSLDDITLGGKAFETGTGVHAGRVAGAGVVAIEIGAGEYTFVTTGMNVAKMMAKVKHVAGRLDRYTTLADLLANPQAKAVLVDATGFDPATLPMAGFILGSPLDALSAFAPHLLTPAKMDEIEAALLAL
jgi:alpha-L-rhamnosidase